MNKKITILGAGESGTGAALLAKQQGFEVFVSDSGHISESYQNELKSLGVDFESGSHTFEKILDAELIIKSPGIPDNAAVVQAASNKGIAVISEPEFASRYFDGKILAITGTNGKTTTTLLAYHILKSAGQNVGLAGNVGISFARQVASESFRTYVLELSSFQLDGIVEFKPEVAILLNITPDHLDRYEGDMQKYIDSKFRIAQNMKGKCSFIYNADNVATTDNLIKVDQEISKYPFSNERPYSPGAYSSNGQLNFSIDKAFAFNLNDSPLIGKHNQGNLMAAMMACNKLGLDWEIIAEGVKTFKNTAHRLEKVAEIKGVTYINDSKATNVDAVYYALEGIKTPIIWIAGGVDKGNDYSQLFPVLGQVKSLICMGQDNGKLKKAFQSKIEKVEDLHSLAQVIDKAHEIAQVGDTVLLSPACASFDLFKNYIDRGDQFKKAVLAIADHNHSNHLTHE